MGTKRCSKCGEEKPLSEYHRSSSSRDGRMSRCKTCRSADTRNYVERRRRAEALAEHRGIALREEGVELDL